MRIVGNDPTLSRQLTATASGAISAAGKSLIVNTDGTVAQAGDIAPSAGSEAVILESAVGGYYSLVYAGDNNQTTADANKVVVIFRDQSNSNYGTAVVGTVSGTSVSFGSKVVFESATVHDMDCCMDSSQGKVLVFYRDSANSNYGTGVVGTVSGTGISFGTPAVFESATTTHISCDFDNYNGKALVAYRDGGNSSHGTALTADYQLNYGSAAVFESAHTQNPDVTYDPNADRFLISYRDMDNSYYGTAIVATISGSSVSYGTAVVFSSANTTDPNGACDTTNNKVVVTYVVSGSIKAIVGTISSTSVSFGSEALVTSNTAYLHNNTAITYDPDTGRVMVGYFDSTDFSHGKIALGTVSGTSISFGDPFKFNAGTTYYVSVVYNKGTDNFVVTYEDYGNSGYLTSIIIEGGGNNLTTENFIGTAAHAAADGAKVLVNTQGAIDENQSGLTAGQTFFVDKNGALQLTTNTAQSLGSETEFTTSAANYIQVVYDSNSDRSVIIYRNGDNSKGEARVGTVSGTSISYGTAVEFEQGNTEYIGATFDSNSNKVVIAYRDTSNSNYGTAIVGTVDSSDNSISFGTAVVFESAHAWLVDATFDSSNNKVVIVYTDNGNSNYGTAVVGTVSGTSISFGTPVVFKSAATYYASATFDTTNNKVVVFYDDQSNLNGIVGTVSGTSISFGSETSAQSGAHIYIDAAFDSYNGKVLAVGANGSNSNYGEATVGTVSGTDISFGTTVTYESAISTYNRVVFDSNINKFIVTYRDQGDSNKGKFIVGTISGTDVSFSGLTVFNDANTTYNGTDFDSTSNRVVIAYKDDGDGDDGTVRVLQNANDLSGSLSTDAVPAGTALSATKLLVKG